MTDKTNAELADLIDTYLKRHDKVGPGLGAVHLLEQASAALRRQPSSDQVLVPREPTVAMLERGWNESRHELAGTPSARACYRAMLAAAEAEGKR